MLSGFELYPLWVPLTSCALALRARALLLVFEKLVLVLIYSKLHEKLCDYLYKLNIVPFSHLDGLSVRDGLSVLDG